MFPLRNKIELKDIPPANRFGARRKFDVHTGVDLFCDPGDPIFAIEDGEITCICYFTGAVIGMPWWNETMAVAVEGRSGVILYGEIDPIGGIAVGQKIREGEIVGNALTVLKNDKGLPMTMLHLELYRHGYRGDWEFWKLDGEKPRDLLNSEQLL